MSKPGGERQDLAVLSDVRPGASDMDLVVWMAKPAVMQPSPVPTGLDTDAIKARTLLAKPRRREVDLHRDMAESAPRAKRVRVDDEDDDGPPARPRPDPGPSNAVAHFAPSRRFEDLPREVRTMVYQHLFERHDALRPLCQEDRYMEAPGTARPPGLGDVVALLRTSRRIHAEAVEVLYGRNAFLLYARDFGDAALAFLRRIGPVNRRMIRNLELDWQHGITKVNQTSKASDLFAMAGDLNNPLREDLAKMLHDVGRTAIRKFVSTLELMVGSPRLEHLTILCPGGDDPGHPDNCCAEIHGCTGCHRAVPQALAKIQGLKSLTVGDTNARNELEAVAREMGVRELNVTQVDFITLPADTVDELHRQGWTVTISWKDPDGDDFRRVLTKRFSDDGDDDPRSRHDGW
ncbi:MAG: hypothetical protein M1823_001641 [Watsoniomyces obsoletus]|nr:MAG: hypothetical protein M1823_001641 [Watsoniomyces obsoletus]